MSFDKTAYQLS